MLPMNHEKLLAARQASFQQAWSLARLSPSTGGKWGGRCHGPLMSAPLTPNFKAQGMILTLRKKKSWYLYNDVFQFNDLFIRLLTSKIYCFAI